MAAIGAPMTGASPWSARSLFQGFSRLASTVWRAPSALAISRRRGERSTATTSSTPRSRSVAMAARPMGPAPNTATLSPGRARARSTAFMPTPSGSASAATSIGISAGIGNRLAPAAASRTSSRVAKPPSRPPLPTMLPQAVGLRTTRVPSARFETSAPTASTTPESSWPSGMGRCEGPARPPRRTYRRSLPQMPQAETRTTASRGPGSGSAASSMRTSSGP